MAVQKTPLARSSMPPQKGRLHGVGHQHGHGHGPHAPGHRGEGPRHFRHLRVHVPKKPPLYPVHPHVHHHRPGAHPGLAHQVGAARGHHQHLGPPRHLRQVLGLGVGQGGGGVLPEEKGRQRLPHDVGAADDHHLLAPQLHAVVPEEADHPKRRAGEKPLPPAPEPPHVHRVEAVHVLQGRDGLQDSLGADVAGQRELDQDAVHVLVPVQGLYALKKGLLREVLGVDLHLAPEAQLPGPPVLEAHVRDRGRVLPKPDHPQRGHKEKGGELFL